jgi:hypothetical protein
LGNWIGNGGEIGGEGGGGSRNRLWTHGKYPGLRTPPDASVTVQAECVRVASVCRRLRSYSKVRSNCHSWMCRRGESVRYYRTVTFFPRSDSRTGALKHYRADTVMARSGIPNTIAPSLLPSQSAFAVCTWVVASVSPLASPRVSTLASPNARPLAHAPWRRAAPPSRLSTHAPSMPPPARPPPR